MAMMAMETQMPGWRLKSFQAPAIQVQPWPAGTECPSAMKFCCAAMADPPWLLLLQSYSYRGNRLGHQRAVLVFRLAVDEDHAAAVLQTPRLGEQPCAAAVADEGSAHGDVDHAPASTAIACPVMWREASEASSTTSPFRSSSLPRRLVGVQSRISSPVVPSVAWVIFEGKKPGQMALTVMPCCPHSAARARVKFTRPPFVVL